VLSARLSCYKYFFLEQSAKECVVGTEHNVDTSNCYTYTSCNEMSVSNLSDCPRHQGYPTVARITNLS
jgi:hypothetical protein